MIRAALYARVSTLDQDHAMQLTELRELAERRGWSITEYTDEVSGARRRRPGLDRLRADLQAGRIHVVAVWRLDRLGRSALDLLHLLRDITTAGASFVSARDAGLDTTSPAGEVLLMMLAAFAQFERSIMQERTRAGLAQARARGRRLGRPPLALDQASAEAAVAAHGGIAAAARALRVSRNALKARLRGGQKTSRIAGPIVGQEPQVILSK